MLVLKVVHSSIENKDRDLVHFFPPFDEGIYLRYYNYERATLARATRVVIHSYLSLGLRPSVRWKITSDNGNLRNLRYTKNICHLMLALIT